MRKENRRQYEKIILNSILKEGSKWEFTGIRHLKNDEREVDIYRHNYRIVLPDEVHLLATIEYDAKTGKYQMSDFARFRGNHMNFRWLQCLFIDDYLKID